jgi:hypothetical protein
LQQGASSVRRASPAALYMLIEEENRSALIGAYTLDGVRVFAVKSGGIGCPSCILCRVSR